MLLDTIDGLRSLRAKLKQAVRAQRAGQRNGRTRPGFDTEWDSPTIIYRGKKRPDPLRASLVGYSVALGGRGYYIPVYPKDHPAELAPGLYAFNQAARKLLRFVEVEGFEVWAHNWKSELHVLGNEGYTVRVRMLDSEIASWLVGWRIPGKPGLKLKHLAKVRLGYDGPDFDALANGRKASEIPVAEIAPYAAKDAVLTHDLGELAWERMDELELYEQYELDRRCIPITAHMERTGVPLDRDLLLAAADRCEVEMGTVSARFRELTTTTLLLPTKVREQKTCPACGGLGTVTTEAEGGVVLSEKACTAKGCVSGLLFFKNGRKQERTVERLRPQEAGADVGNDRQVARWLFDELKLWPTHGPEVGEPENPVIPRGYEHPRNEVSWSVKDEDIRRFTNLPGVPGELARLRLRFQALRKYASTYTRGLVSLAEQSGDGRLHCGFKQDGTRTQRYSSSGPNLQNLPSSERQDLPWLKDLPDVRAAFGAAPGWLVVVRDLSQIELRLLAHFSADPNLLHVYRTGGDIHAMTMEALRVNRRNAKIGNFSVSYMISAFSLAKKVQMGANDFSYTKEQAHDFIEGWYGQYSNVRPWQEEVIEEAEANGFARTLTGFVELIPNWRRFIGRDGEWHRPGASERKAVNTPIQGSAAGILKRIMVALYERWLKSGDLGTRVKFVGQVHDELIFEAREDFAAEVDRTVEAAMVWVGRHYKLRVPLASSGGRGHTWSEAK